MYEDDMDAYYVLGMPIAKTATLTTPAAKNQK